MATILAPYTNGMRLGQGFNSYTQQICLDRAVLEDTPENRAVERRNIGGPLDSIDVQDNDNETSLNRIGSTNEHQVQGDDRFTTPPWVKPQIVTYSSRFVDKISDVTDAMNISGSVAIKTATIGGKINGAYIDSDKFKQSDINFHLQVRVKNEETNSPKFAIFNKISTVEEKDFTNVYGDSFISGWETGGELNAIISVSVKDKSKIFDVKAGLEAEITQGAISGGITGNVNMEKSELNSSTETTISVNWSGGGMIKETSEQWTIETLKRVAAGFPDMVAITPQRTYAILTKYTSLESFHRHKVNFSPLSYENAGVYTNSLMEHYMDYKSLWKQISGAQYELENNRASIDMAQPSQDVYSLATVRFLPTAQVEPAASKNKAASPALGGALSEDSGDSIVVLSKDEPPTAAKKAQPRSKQLSLLPSAAVQINEENASVDFKVFPPTFAGLIQARQVCRWEMSKIVNEVDLVAKDPRIASDGQRDLYFLNPLIFKQLLPIVRSASPQDAVLDVKNPNSALLLGYQRTELAKGVNPDVHEFAERLEKHDGRLVRSVGTNKHKSVNYRMLGCAGGIADVHTAAEFFNDLDYLDATYCPEVLEVWMMEGRVVGLRTRYTNSQTVAHGQTSGPPSYALTLSRERSEVITEVRLEEGTANQQHGILSLAMATSLCKTAGIRTPTTATSPIAPTATSQPPTITSKTGDQTSKTTESKDVEVSVSRTSNHNKVDQRQWSVRGFFGFFVHGNFKSLGTVWGKDTFVPVQNIPVVAPLARNYLGLSEELQKKVTNIMIGQKDFASHFCIGASISTGATHATVKQFNTLDDGLDVDWRLTSLAFRSNAQYQLIGLALTYTNGEQLSHGQTEGGSVWQVHTPKALVGIKITVGHEQSSPQVDSSEAPAPKQSPAIDKVELVQVDENGSLPVWPLDQVTNAIRWLGHADEDATFQVSDSLVEMAPALNRAVWSLRGFYGEFDDKSITRLGAIWGHSG